MFLSYVPLLASIFHSLVRNRTETDPIRPQSTLSLSWSVLLLPESPLFLSGNRDVSVGSRIVGRGLRRGFLRPDTTIRFNVWGCLVVGQTQGCRTSGGLISLLPKLTEDVRVEIMFSHGMSIIYIGPLSSQNVSSSIRDNKPPGGGVDNHYTVSTFTPSPWYLSHCNVLSSPGPSPLNPAPQVPETVQRLSSSTHSEFPLCPLLVLVRHCARPGHRTPSDLSLPVKCQSVKIFKLSDWNLSTPSRPLGLLSLSRGGTRGRYPVDPSPVGLGPGRVSRSSRELLPASKKRVTDGNCQDARSGLVWSK